MSAIANIVVFDGAATPVSHTLVPVSVSRENGMIEAAWREQIAGLPVEAQVNASMRQRKLPSGVVQSEFRVNVPVMESISGQNAAGYTAAPKVAFVDTYVITNYAHARSTITSRRLARMLAVNIANNVSTSVAAATTGVAPDLFDTAIMPT